MKVKLNQWVGTLLLTTTLLLSACATTAPDSESNEGSSADVIKNAAADTGTTVMIYLEAFLEILKR